MRYFQGIPENFLRDAFEYDPDSPSGLVRLRSHSERRDKSNHVRKPKVANGFRAMIMIGGKPHKLKKGEMIIMPAGVPHSLKAPEPFKMLLIMIRS